MFAQPLAKLLFPSVNSQKGEDLRTDNGDTVSCHRIQSEPVLKSEGLKSQPHGLSQAQDVPLEVQSSWVWAHCPELRLGATQRDPTPRMIFDECDIFE